ncbi:MAG: Rossmann-like and DUF2520 domain-containing protein [Rikenellaceae bacterium]
MKKIVIVGSGNVAYSLALTFDGNCDYKLVQIISRSESKGQKLAQLSNSTWGDFSWPVAIADIYILAVRDSAIDEVAKILLPKIADGSIICHSSAVTPLIECSERNITSGRFYPLQTFTENIKSDFKKIIIFIESKCSKTEQNLVALSNSISKSHIVIKGDELEKIHLAATFANNFTNRMYHHAEEILAECGLERSILYPLIQEGVDKLVNSSLKAKYLQTGAAVRGDEKTIQRHRAMLSPKRRELYDLITKDIKDDKF